MLQIIIPKREWYNEGTEEFETEPEVSVSLEHSLVSLSQWESKWKKPFLPLLTKNGLSPEEILDYIGMMIVSPPNDVRVHLRFSPENIEETLRYIGDSQTATVINERKQRAGRDRIVTSELIYAWMAMSGVEKAYETWNLNRLITLLNVIAIESDPKPAKMTHKEAAAYQRSVNERNKALLRTKG